MELRSQADKELVKLERDARACKAIFPKWLLLKANSYSLSGRAATSLYSQVRHWTFFFVGKLSM